MTTLFPVSLDDYTNPLGNQSQNVTRTHSQQHGDLNDAIEAVQRSLGITNSADVTSVRYALSQYALSGGSSLIGFLQAGIGATPRTLQARGRDFISALDYAGVDPTGAADSAPGINAALTYAKSVGKNVFLPCGVYQTLSSIVVPGGTQLEGEGWQPYTAYGTVATLGKGTIIQVNFAGAPGIIVQKDGANRTSGAKIFNLAMFWNHAAPAPGWVPTVYDWAIKVDRADDVTIEDVLLVNPYKGIQITGTNTEPAGRLNLSRVFGQPLLTGVDIDFSVDVSCLDRVHFWPFWSDNANVLSWMKANNAVFMRSARNDNCQLTNLFGFGYARGIQITSNAFGTTARMAGANIDIDDCARGFWVDSAAAGASGSFVNFNSTGSLSVVADMFVIEGNATHFAFDNLRLTNSQQHSILCTGTTRLHLNNYWADTWNISAGGFSAINAASGAEVYVENGKFTNGGAGGFVSGAGKISLDEWIAYTPVITPTAGTITTVTTTYAKFRRKGRMVDVSVEISVVNNGTGSGALIMTLPVTAINGAVIPGRERALTGRGVLGQVSATQASLSFGHDNSYPAANGSFITLFGSYEVA